MPFVDVVTTERDTAQLLTVAEWDEWGDPLHNASAYEYMLSYSPYDNIRKCVPSTRSLRPTACGRIAAVEARGGITPDCLRAWPEMIQTSMYVLCKLALCDAHQTVMPAVA